MSRILIFCVLSLAAASAWAFDEDHDWLDAGGYTAVAAWMVEHTDPEMQAAGMLALAAERGDDRTMNAEGFLAEAEALLADEPTAEAVFLLAQACAAWEVLEACEALGVPEAAGRLDGGNVLATALFHPNDPAGYREAVLEAERIDDHFIASTSAWFDALLDYPSPELPGGSELTAAIGITMAVALPGLNGLTQRCRDAIGSDPQLDEACQRLAGQMRDSGKTLFLRTIGYGMGRQRAELTDQPERAAEYRQQARVLNRQVTCYAEAAGEALATDTALQRQYLARFREDGEIAAFKAVAGEAGEACEPKA
jgi:hypothetical protein